MRAMIRILKNLSTKFSYMVNKSKIQSLQSSTFDSKLHSFFGVKNCYLCDEKIKTHPYFCDNCYQDLPTLNTKCFTCCLPLTLESHDLFSSNLLCGECISKPPSFNQTFCAYEYRFPINQIIRRIKYSKQRYWIKPLCQLLADEISVAELHCNHFSRPDILIPIPMHKSKSKIRGFNQADLIANFLSKKLNIPVAKKILLKTKNTETQAQLNKKQRMNNLQGSLSISKSTFKNNLLKGKHIALVDDVMTTKTTCELASKLLLASGASRVDVMCIARTPKEN
ncbi:MAG: ComF family protein [Oleiphilaceae bacterium]|jgi:ComF family protein